MSELFDRIRLIPRAGDFLGRITGSSGQIYTNKTTGSLRVYDGDNQGGAELARADFANIEDNAALNLKGEKNRIRFAWTTLTELETEVDPSIYAGMIAYVAAENRLYFAEVDGWKPVANLSEISESGTQIPYTPDDSNTLLHVSGTYDFGNNILKYANAIDQESQLSNYDPSVYHGMTMHVHSTGALYYAHDGAWRKLLTDTSFNNVEAAGYVSPLGPVAYSNSYVDLDNTPNSILDFGIVDGASGQVLSTNGAGSFSFIDVATESGSSFDLIETDNGSFDPSELSTLSFSGGDNISTEVVTDSDAVTINLNSFSINFLSDVDTQSNPPSTGEVLKWDGAKWSPGTDIAEGGTGLDADTLDGQDGSYYLNYNNFTNTPDVLTLDELGVNNEAAASGNGAISYDNTTGLFRYTPPTAAGIGAASLSDFSVTVDPPGVTSLTYNDSTGVFSYTPPQLGDFEFTGTILDTVGSAQITVTPDVNFSGAVSFTTLSSTGVGTLTLDSASSIALVAEDDISFSAGTGSIILDNQSWPQADGASGEVLSTDGQGQLSWQSVSGNDQNLFETISADSGSTTADTVTDTLTVSGGTDITTSVSGDVLTIDFTGTGSNQNVFETVSGDFGSTTADTSSDTLTVSGGTDISTSVSGDTLTINYTGGGGGVTDFSQLTDAQNANQRTIDQVFETAICTLRGIANGFVSYSWEDHYTGENPTIYALSGTTLAFDLNNLAGHPTEIQDASGNPLTTGLTWVSPSGQVLTGASANDQQTGTLYWRINESISGNFLYQCTAHASMVGDIVVKRLSLL